MAQVSAFTVLALENGSHDPNTASAQMSRQAKLIRDVFANPFRPVTLAPDYRSPSVLMVAQAAYDERQLPSGELDPHRLAVLADALEDAGCTDQGIMAHLRGPGPHVRGCFVVDLCLGLT
jgi:hypothetical protein